MTPQSLDFTVLRRRQPPSQIIAEVMYNSPEWIILLTFILPVVSKKLSSILGLRQYH